MDLARGELKESLLDDFRYRIEMPDNAHEIRSEHLRGGILKFAQVRGSDVDEHVVIYRFFNGGSDEGRSRVTMLSAWTTCDQFPSAAEAYGVLEILVNQTFESISQQARTIGIERPYSLIANELLPSKVNLPSKALADFLCGLADEDHDYSLTIYNDIHALKKTPSAFYIYKSNEAARKNREEDLRRAEQQKQKAEQEKHEAEQEKRALDQARGESQVEKLSVKKTSKQREQPISNKSMAESETSDNPKAENRKSVVERGLSLLLVLTSLAVFSLLVILAKDFFWGSPETLSPTAQQVVERFSNLSRQDQLRVLNRLQTIVNQQNQNRMVQPNDQLPPRSSRIGEVRPKLNQPSEKLTPRDSYSEPLP